MKNIILFDKKEYEELDVDMEAKDVLKFQDTKRYVDRLVEMKKKVILILIFKGKKK